MDLPAFIHSGHPPLSLPHSIIQPVEDFPKVRIVMVHMGYGNGIYIRVVIDLSKKHDNVYLETSGMPMHIKIRETYNTVGSRQVFWGSDTPFHHYRMEMLRAEVCGLPESALENIFYRNIKRFLVL